MELKGDRSYFAESLREMKLIVLDSSIMIYHLEECRPYSELTKILISMTAGGALSCIISTISITEILSKPYSEFDSKKIIQIKRFIHMLPNTTISAPDENTADYAAYLRGNHGLRTPDALLLAAVKIGKADAIVTNDRHLRRAEKDGIKVMLLDDYIRQ